MSYTVKEGDTAPVIAQNLTGNSANWPHLKAPGWDGSPEGLKPGMVVTLDTEQPGPPARPPSGLKR